MKREPGFYWVTMPGGIQTIAVLGTPDEDDPLFTWYVYGSEEPLPELFFESIDGPVQALITPEQLGDALFKIHHHQPGWNYYLLRN